MSDTPHSYDRDRALTLAKSGDYEDWQAICRKMLFEGWGIQIFDDAAFTQDLNLACSISRASRSAKPVQLASSTSPE